MCTLCTEQRIRGADAPNELPNGRTLGIKGVINPWFLMSGFLFYSGYYTYHIVRWKGEIYENVKFQCKTAIFLTFWHFSLTTCEGVKISLKLQLNSVLNDMIVQRNCTNNTSGKVLPGRNFSGQERKKCAKIGLFWHKNSR